MYEDYKVGCPEPNPGTPDDSSNEESSSDSDDAHDQQEDFLWDLTMFDPSHVQDYITSLILILTMIISLNSLNVTKKK